MSLISTALSLQDLPPPLPGKIGWPWTKQTEPFSALPDGSRCPRISIITPSYNQGHYLEETIRSILLQGYPNLEYWVIDGGSTDNTLDILQKYDPYLSWISERDRGQSDALNKGFRRATGKLIGWQNSDDFYQPQAFFYAACKLRDCPQADAVYGNINFVNESGQFLQAYPVMTEAESEKMIPYSGVCNHSVFYTHKIFEENNYIDESLKHCMDQEFLLRLMIQGYHFVFEPKIVANWRIHEGAKSAQQMNIWAKEAFDLCKKVYSNPNLEHSLRQKAKESLHGICRDNFGKLRLSLFQQSVREWVELFGWRSLGLELSLKYGLSFVGKDAIARLKALKNRN
ncbi:MAG: glycosyltransferase family 2 protein [Cyanobacteriota bacterium]|nr:glycosyltransferase family 2 protein [Cyanobacteriota bacterium]